MNFASISATRVAEDFSELIVHLHGSLDIKVSKPGNSADPHTSEMLFIHRAKNLDLIKGLTDLIVILPLELADSATSLTNTDGICFFASKNLQLAMALINTRYFLPLLDRQPYGKDLIHASATISDLAKIEEGAIIGPNVVIGPNVKIGEKTFIGANCVIEANTRVGKSCFIQPQVYIGHSCDIGNHVMIKPHSTIGTDGYGFATDDEGMHHRKPHYGKVILEDHVHIGANVNIDRGTFGDSVIGLGTKIDNHCHLAHNTVIGRHCLITAGFITAGSSKIGDHCVFGGRSTIAGHIEIGNHIHAAGLTTIPKSLLRPGAYGGYPPQPLKDFFRMQASLSHLPDIRKQLAKLSKKVGLNN